MCCLHFLQIDEIAKEKVAERHVIHLGLKVPSYTRSFRGIKDLSCTVPSDVLIYSNSCSLPRTPLFTCCSLAALCWD